MSADPAAKTDRKAETAVDLGPLGAGSGGGLRWGSVCITGNFRDNNEDNLSVAADGSYFVVADGMGGQSAGEKASELAVDHLVAVLDKDAPADRAALSRLLKETVAAANAEIVALGNVEPKYHGMGTTIVCLVPCEGGFVAGNLGDSRAYRCRNGDLEQITKDHSLTQALIDAGTITPEEAKTHRYKNMLFKYLGSKEGNDGAEVFPLDRQPGDRFVICSDGVTDGLSDERMRELLVAEADPQDAAEKMVAAAQEGGSRDNITCVVVHVD